MEIKIEKGVPVPRRRTKGSYLEVFDEMEVGDSFVVSSLCIRQYAWRASRVFPPKKWIVRNKRRSSQKLVGGRF